MTVFDIVIPGHSIESSDRDWARETEKQLWLLRRIFFEANTALILFQETRAPRSSSVLARRSQDEVAIRRALDDNMREDTPRQGVDVLLEAQAQLNKERWMNGTMPEAFESLIPYIYARSFLYALDMFGKLLGALAKEPSAPIELRKCHDEFLTTFQELKGVRNTIQHLEDRSRGLTHGKPIQPRKYSEAGIRIEGIALDFLIGTRFGSTMADGQYGQVDVSNVSMEKLKAILEGVLMAFDWTGPKQYEPLN